LQLNAETATLKGGKDTVEIPICNSNYVDAIASAQVRCEAAVLACEHSALNLKTKVRLPNGVELAVPNTGLLFKAKSGFVSDEALGEFLIGRIDFVRYLLKAMLLGRADSSIDFRAMSEEALLHDFVRAGKVGVSDFAYRVRDLEQAKVPVAHAFYTSAVRNLGEEVRHALFRAGYHLQNLTNRLCEINRTESARDYPGAPQTGPCERQSVGSKYDPVSYEFSEAVTAAYSSLDYLYRFFVFVTRRPVGDPKRPTSLHFPDVDPAKAVKEVGGLRPSDISVAVAPLAIPNLTAKSFGSLRRSRNDIAHNFGTDDIRPIIYVGIQRPPKDPLQYVQYTVRDIAPDGTPSSHPWCEQFYIHQRDAQDSAYEYLESCWNCAIDTMEWLIVRLKDECKLSGIPVRGTPGDGFYFL